MARTGRGEIATILTRILFTKEAVRASFVKRSLGKDLAVIEGNRGVFDGVDAEGSYSTGELAKLLAAPVILVVDATKMTRTAARASGWMSGP